MPTIAEERSLALHAAVAVRLRAEPALVDAARGRVERWLADGSVHPTYAKGWERLLSLPLADLLEALVDPGERACALRQSSPFAGVLDARTRWQVWREVRDRQAAGSSR